MTTSYLPRALVIACLLAASTTARADEAGHKLALVQTAQLPGTAQTVKPANLGKAVKGISDVLRMPLRPTDRDAAHRSLALLIPLVAQHGGPQTMTLLEMLSQTSRKELARDKLVLGAVGNGVETRHIENAASLLSAYERLGARERAQEQARFILASTAQTLSSHAHAAQQEAVIKALRFLNRRRTPTLLSDRQLAKLLEHVLPVKPISRLAPLLAAVEKSFSRTNPPSHVADSIVQSLVRGIQPRRDRTAHLLRELRRQPRIRPLLHHAYRRGRR